MNILMCIQAKIPVISDSLEKQPEALKTNQGNLALQKRDNSELYIHRIYRSSREILSYPLLIYDFRLFMVFVVPPYEALCLFNTKNDRCKQMFHGTVQIGSFTL